MVAAMAGFAVEDALLKSASALLPVGEVMVLFGTIGATLFAGLATLRGETLFQAAAWSRPMLIRVVFEFTGRLFYMLALAMTPLSSATAILQATPIVVVFGAVMVFGERVGWKRWSAIVTGLIGVLVILRPATEAFSPLSLLAVLGMLGFAGRDLASRAAPLSLSPLILGFYGFATVAVAGAIYAVWDGASFAFPEGRISMALAATAVVGVFSYAALMTAMRTGEVATVTPFRYSRLIFGLLLGVVVFGESIEFPMVIGSIIVVASGLFILSRGRDRPMGTHRR
jgi:drug/metabolite transporter (DMT)-like permease